MKVTCEKLYSVVSYDDVLAGIAVMVAQSPYFELPNGRQYFEPSENLGSIWSLCRKVLA